MIGAAEGFSRERVACASIAGKTAERNGLAGGNGDSGRSESGGAIKTPSRETLAPRVALYYLRRIYTTDSEWSNWSIQEKGE
jgi:hypothetical protein